MILENQNSPHAEGIKKAVLNKAGRVSFTQKMHLCLSERAQVSALLYPTILSLAR